VDTTDSNEILEKAFHIKPTNIGNDNNRYLNEIDDYDTLPIIQPDDTNNNNCNFSDKKSGIFEIDSLVRVYNSINIPGLVNDYLLYINEFPIAGLWEKNKMQMYKVDYRSNDEYQSNFRNEIFIYQNENVVNYLSPYGGYGIMSS